jgi:hypothetical protein
MDFRRFKVVVENNSRYGRDPRSVLAMRGDELEGTFLLLADDKNKLGMDETERRPVSRSRGIRPRGVRRSGEVTTLENDACKQGSERDSVEMRL